MEAVRTKEGEVTFYSWRENIPSSEKIYICGGLRQKDANGNILATGQKDAHFARGLYRTSDPEIIEGLRKLIREGKNDMSENKEDYIKATLPVEKQAARNAALIAEKDKELNQSREEVSRLCAKLQEKAAAGDPRSKVKKSDEVPE